MILQHNLPGITSNRNMAKNKAKLSKNLEKLSSGYLIFPADDNRPYKQIPRPGTYV